MRLWPLGLPGCCCHCRFLHHLQDGLPATAGRAGLGSTAAAGVQGPGAMKVLSRSAAQTGQAAPMLSILQAVLDCCARLLPALAILGSSDAVGGLGAFLTASLQPLAHRRAWLLGLAGPALQCTAGLGTPGVQGRGPCLPSAQGAASQPTCSADVTAPLTRAL